MNNQQELLLSAVWESSADAMRITDSKGKVINVNTAYCTLTGFNKKTVVGKSFEIVYDKEEQQNLLKYYKDFISREIPTERSHKIVTFHDGRIRYIEASYSQINIPGDKYILAVIRDITEFMRTMEDVKNAHIEIKESEEKFRNLSEESPNMIFINKAGRVVYVNNKCTEVLGYTREEFLDPRFNFLDLIAPDCIEMVKDNFAKRYKGEAKESYEYALLTKNKNRIETTITSKIVCYEGGDAILGIVTDISELKNAENSLLLKNLVFEKSISANSIADSEGNITETNDMFLKAWGYSKKEDCIGKSIAEFLQNSDEVAAILKALNETGAWKGEYTARRKDGTNFIAFGLATVLKDEDGNLIGYQSSVNDITEQKQAEMNIKQKNKELVKLNAEKDKFFSIIAHDLRSPFTGFIGFTELLKTDLFNMNIGELTDIANTLNNSAHNLFGLLTNLLDWSMMQRGLVAFRPEKLELKSLMDESINIFYDTAKKKGIEIKEKTSGNIFASVDKAMFDSIMRNLVSNAIKFTKTGGRITISADKFEDSVVISVKDTGIGMSSDLIKDLFRIDKRTNKEGTENEPSTGLGLILCKEFVEKHNGKLWVVSEEWKGSEISFSLPIN